MLAARSKPKTTAADGTLVMPVRRTGDGVKGRRPQWHVRRGSRVGQPAIRATPAVYLPEIGRWTRRDPLGYVDGMGLYEYCSSHVIDARDGLGLVWYAIQPQPAPPPSSPVGPGGELLKELLRKPYTPGGPIPRVPLIPDGTFGLPSGPTSAPAAPGTWACVEGFLVRCLKVCRGAGVVAIVCSATPCGDSSIGPILRMEEERRERCEQARQAVRDAKAEPPVKLPGHQGASGSEERQFYCEALRRKIDRQARIVGARYRVFEECYWSNWENDKTGYKHKEQTETDEGRLKEWEHKWNTVCAGEIPA